MDIEGATRDFILRELLYEEEGVQLGDDESLIARHAIDSVGLLRLIVFLEETYDIQVMDEGLAPENFETIRKIAEMVRRQQSTKAKG